MIEIKELCAGYDRKEILHGVSARFENGSVTVVLGPNGSGKSTLLETIVGLLPAASGSICVDHAELSSLNGTERARRLAFLAQEPVIPNMTARRMVLHGRFPYLGWPRQYRREDHEAVERALERTGALMLADRPMQKLSGGERQRVRFAMLLAQNTPNILMDEPTTFLDAGSQLETAALARSLAAEGKTVILVLHDLRLAMQTADRVLLLQNGRSVQKGSPEELLAAGRMDEVFGIRLRRTDTPDGPQYYYA